MIVNSSTLTVFQSTSPVWRTTCDTVVAELADCIFQSTSPVWRTTRDKQIRFCVRGISIHVPRVEDDPLNTGFRKGAWNFNPRPPCGGRPAAIEGRLYIGIISIHVPRVEDDASLTVSGLCSSISIHVPRVEDDRLAMEKRGNGIISIHVPRVEDDGACR